MTISEINKELKDLYKIKPLRMYFELISYAIIGYGLYFYALINNILWPLIFSAIFIYRGISFIHEVSHYYQSLPIYKHLYNFLFGYINRVPAYSMKTHKFHHNTKAFGTIQDPEYDTWTKRKKIFLARPFILSFFYPLFLTLRFGIWPIMQYVFPSSYRLSCFHKFSTFVMNLNYIRPFDKEDFEDVKKQDLMTALFFIIITLISYQAEMLFRVYSFWYYMVVFISLMNTYRALVAHRYQVHLNPHDDKRIEQLMDSVCIEGNILTEIWAPVGLRYHSTHHFLPNLPYYSLGKAHKRLKRILPSDHPYHKSIEKNFISAFSKLVSSCQ